MSPCPANSEMKDGKKLSGINPMVAKLTHIESAEKFQALHRKPIFVLANAWDVAGARIFEMAGFNAIGTTSAGIAATLGFPDGQRIPVEATAEVVHRLVSRTNLPVSADIEAGYGPGAEDAARSARIVLEAGAVGINLEDSYGEHGESLYDIALQQDKIRAIREITTGDDVRLFINARTDAFMLSGMNVAERVRLCIERANAYIAAGADGIFVPDLEDMDLPTMKVLVDEINAPLNIIAGAITPSLAQLKEIGVTRVSLGPRHMRATFALLKKIANEIMSQGTFSYTTAEMMSYSEVNTMFQSDS